MNKFHEKATESGEIQILNLQNWYHDWYHQLIMVPTSCVTLDRIDLDDILFHVIAMKKYDFMRILLDLTTVVDYYKKMENVCLDDKENKTFGVKPDNPFFEPGTTVCVLASLNNDYKSLILLGEKGFKFTMPKILERMRGSSRENKPANPNSTRQQNRTCDPNDHKQKLKHIKEHKINAFHNIKLKEIIELSNSKIRYVKAKCSPARICYNALFDFDASDQG